MRNLVGPLLFVIAVSAQAVEPEHYDSGFDQNGNEVVTDGAPIIVGEPIQVWTDDGWKERYVEEIDPVGDSLEVELEDTQDRLFLY